MQCVNSYTLHWHLVYIALHYYVSVGILLTSFYHLESFYEGQTLLVTSMVNQKCTFTLLEVDAVLTISACCFQDCACREGAPEGGRGQGVLTLQIRSTCSMYYPRYLLSKFDCITNKSELIYMWIFFVWQLFL